MTQQIGKVPVVVKSSLSYEGAKSKYLKIWYHGQILRFHLFWNLQYLLTKLLEGFDIKTAFSSKNGHLELLVSARICPGFQTLKAFFLKHNFSLICYDDVINEITVTQERNV